MALDEEFTLEKLKIVERLHDLEIQVARLVSHMQSEQGTITRIHQQFGDQMSQINKILERHDKILLGDGEPGAGMMTRMDRLEQSESSRKTNIQVIWGAIVVGFSKMFFDTFKH